MSPARSIALTNAEAGGAWRLSRLGRYLHNRDATEPRSRLRAMGNEKRTLVVLGAGASRDIWDGHSPRIEEHWQPPLASELFNFSARPNYYGLAETHVGAGHLGLEIARETDDDFDLEARLREYASHKDEQVRRWFRDVPPYLRDLLTNATYKYVRTPGNYILLLKKLVLDHGHHVGFVVMNYDNLLERSLEQLGWTVADFNSYCAQGRFGPVVKLHGSIDWFQPFGNDAAPWRDVLDDVSGPIEPKWEFLGKEERYPEAATLAPRVLRNPNTVENLCAQGRRLYPILTAPMAGKDPESFACPAGHIDALREWSRSVTRLLIVGHSGRDDNLMKLLTTCVGELAIVHHVGGEDVAACAERYRQGVPKIRESKSHEWFANGLDTYLKSALFGGFLSA